MKELLAKCGLSSSEQAVLLQLLKYGASSGGNIARRANIKRTTVYTALASLEEQGLVFKSKGETATIFSVIEQGQILNALRKKAQQEYNSVLEAVEMLEPRLSQFPRSSRHLVGGYEVTYTESMDGVLTVLEAALLQEYLGIWNPAVGLHDKFAAVGEKALKANTKTKPVIRDICIKSDQAYEWQALAAANPNHQVRMMAGDTSLYTDLLLAGGVVNMFNYNIDQPMVIQIKHPDYYRYMVMIFNHIWRTLEE